MADEMKTDWNTVGIVDRTDEKYVYVTSFDGTKYSYEMDPDDLSDLKPGDMVSMDPDDNGNFVITKLNDTGDSSPEPWDGIPEQRHKNWFFGRNKIMWSVAAWAACLIIIPMPYGIAAALAAEGLMFIRRD